MALGAMPGRARTAEVYTRAPEKREGPANDAGPFTWQNSRDGGVRNRHDTRALSPATARPGRATLLRRAVRIPPLARRDLKQKLGRLAPRSLAAFGAAVLAKEGP